jgi:hypothetical protein
LEITGFAGRKTGLFKPVLLADPIIDQTTRWVWERRAVFEKSGLGPELITFQAELGVINKYFQKKDGRFTKIRPAPER